MKRTISVLLLLCMLTMLLPVAALADGGEAAAAPAAEQTAEVNTEDSAEPFAAGTSEEIVDAPASGESADDSDREDAPAGDATQEPPLPETQELAEETAATSLALDGETAERFYVSVNEQFGMRGTITVNGNTSYPAEIAVGTEVTLVAQGPEGYEKVAATWNAYSGGPGSSVPLAVEETTPGTFTFTMPAANVSFSITFYPSDAVKLTYHMAAGGNDQSWSRYASNNGAELLSAEVITGAALPEGKVIAGWAVGGPEGETAGLGIPCVH